MIIMFRLFNIGENYFEEEFVFTTFKPIFFIWASKSAFFEWAASSGEAKRPEDLDGLEDFIVDLVWLDIYYIAFCNINVFWGK